MSYPLLVLHTSESSNLDATVRDMVKRRVWSHRAYDPAEDRAIQIVGWDEPARSLRNEPGGVETNHRPEVYQLEIIAEADDVPGKSEQWFQRLAREVKGICEETGTPLVFPKPFIPYNHGQRPSSYGLDNGVRYSFEEWASATGIVGHMHVPENTHGDPGDITRLVEILTGSTGWAPPTDTVFEDDAAVRFIQSKLGNLEVDGVFGPKTRAAFEDRLMTGADPDIGERLEQAEQEVADLTRDLDEQANRFDALLAAKRSETLAEVAEAWNAFSGLVNGQ